MVRSSSRELDSAYLSYNCLMEATIYTPQKSFKIFCGIVTALLVFGFISSIGNSYLYSATDNAIGVAAFLLLIFFATYPGFGSRLIIRGAEIDYFRYFFWKRSFQVSDISSIEMNDVPNGKGVPIPCLFIYYKKDAQTKKIFLPFMWYGRKNFAAITSHIKRLAPSVNIAESVAYFSKMPK
jgi:hypothetical protein